MRRKRTALRRRQWGTTMPYPIMSTNTVMNRNTSGERLCWTSEVTPSP